MKVECPECAAREEPAWVRGKASGEVEVKCAACGVVSVMSASKLAPPREPGVAALAVTCPKCSHQQQNSHSCDRCGLVFSRWDPGKARAPSDEAAEALWAAVDREWGSDAKHRAFVDYCTAGSLFAYAAQQYGRERASEERRARSETQVAGLAAIAQAALAASQAAPSRWTVRRIRAVMAIVAFAVCAALLLVIASRFL